MPRTLVASALTIVIVCSAIAAHAAPPKVVKAVPNNGAVGVDPARGEIRVTFDQPMSEGMSFVGGGESYPEVVGSPQWDDSKTIVMQVKLKPNHEYYLSINNDRFRNFTNPAGEPATPYPIKFRTGRVKSDSKSGSPDATANGNAPTLSEKENRRAVNLLRSAIRDHYSYRDRLNIDWDELFKSQEESLIDAKSPTEFAQIAGTILARAQDKHIWFQVGNDIIGSFVRPSVPNANYSLLPQLVPGFTKHGSNVASGRWEDGIGYLAIAAWDNTKLNGGKLVFEALDSLGDIHALVIDVRLNGGGAEPLAQQVAGCFVGERKLYAKHVYRDPKNPNGFTAPTERWLEPNDGRPRFNGPVAVLSGPAVMSSCESFLMMMKCAPDTVIVGGVSQGSSGNPKPYDLGNGVTAFLPSWKDLTPDGKELEGVGVSPDIEVVASPKDFQSADPVLAAALTHLRSASKK